MTHPHRQHYPPLTARPAQVAEPVQTKSANVRSLEEDQAKMDALCDRIVAGEFLKHVVEPTFGSLSSFYRCLDRYPELRSQYETAKSVAAHALADEAVLVFTTEPDVQRAKGKSDAIRWLAARRNPKAYGERLDLAINEQLDIRDAYFGNREWQERVDKSIAEYRRVLPAVLEAEVIPPDPEPPGLLR